MAIRKVRFEYIDTEGCEGNEVPSHAPRTLSWWQIFAAIADLLRVFVCESIVHIRIDPLLAKRGYRIAVQDKGEAKRNEARCSTELLHYKEFLISVGSGARRFYAFDSDEEEAPIKMCARRRAIEPAGDMDMLCFALVESKGTNE